MLLCIVKVHSFYCSALLHCMYIHSLIYSLIDRYGVDPSFLFPMNITTIDILVHVLDEHIISFFLAQERDCWIMG